MNHDELRELLPLAAAGVLSSGDDAALTEHVRSCAACAEELKRCQQLMPQLTTQLRNLPAPPTPAWLAQRTVQRVKQRREAMEERRFNQRVLVFLVLFSWVTAVAASLASWPVAREVAGIGLLPWLGWSMLLSWVTAGSAVVILGSHRRRGRRNI